MTTKEDLLQAWLPRLWDALRDVRHDQNASAEEALYELFVEMKQQTLAEKLETFSETTIEDQLSAAMIELRNAQKRISELELPLCQRHFELENVSTNDISKEHVAETTKNVHEPKREWTGLNWDDLPEIYVGDTAFMHGAKWAEAKLKEKNK